MFPEEECLQKLSKLKTYQEKNRYLKEDASVAAYFLKEVGLLQEIEALTDTQVFILLSLVKIGQAGIFFQNWQREDNLKKSLSSLAEALTPLETFYKELGGVIGYHLQIKKLLSPFEKKSSTHFESPPKWDFTKNPQALQEMASLGILHTEEIAEIYPLGGAGERLKLTCDKTGIPLPVACLPFMGKTLLEGLIRDLFAREYLFYQLTGKQHITPLIFMTSKEQENDKHLLSILEKNDWFGRGKDTIAFMTQPQVPVITENGSWAAIAPFQPLLKPGGHGVIWKLAKDKGLFDWLEKKGVKKILVRQINNPIAATDGNILGLMGVGFNTDKAFGFASCPRLVNTAEGVDVLIEDETGFRISNIEYVDFLRNGILDHPEPGSLYSAFPANTNILFGDIQAIKKAVETLPFPGMLINLKSQITSLSSDGTLQKTKGGRLETTMQNIADAIVDPSQDKLRTFLTFNERDKTISVTKKAYKKEENMEETPEGCFFTILNNRKKLLENYCHMTVPPMPKIQSYLEEGPSFFLFFHEALGIFYETIAQKIRHGSMQYGSEMQLEIASLQLENCHLDGSLHITATHPIGKKDSSGILRFGEDIGKCHLKNIHIQNRGINRKDSFPFWKNNYRYFEKLEIILEGNSSFFAENITFFGEHKIIVPDGFSAHAFPDPKQGFTLEMTPIH